MDEIAPPSLAPCPAFDDDLVVGAEALEYFHPIAAQFAERYRGADGAISFRQQDSRLVAVGCGDRRYRDAEQRLAGHPNRDSTDQSAA